MFDKKKKRDKTRETANPAPPFLSPRRWKSDDKLPLQQCPPLTLDYGSFHALFSVAITGSGSFFPSIFPWKQLCLLANTLLNFFNYSPPVSYAGPLSLLLLFQVLLRSPHRSACGFTARHFIQSEWQSRAPGQEWQPVGEVVNQQTHTAQPHWCIRYHWVPGRGTLQQSHGDYLPAFAVLLFYISSKNKVHTGASNLQVQLRHDLMISLI